jgi:hypothetical protein
VGASASHEVLQGLVGEHHAKAPGGITRAAFDHGDVVLGVELFHQDREVQGRRAAAQADDLQSGHRRQYLLVVGPPL